jgi:hypothetical protein
MRLGVKKSSVWYALRGGGLVPAIVSGLEGKPRDFWKDKLTGWCSR